MKYLLLQFWVFYYFLTLRGWIRTNTRINLCICACTHQNIECFIEICPPWCEDQDKRFSDTVGIYVCREENNLDLSLPTFFQFCPLVVLVDFYKWVTDFTDMTQHSLGISSVLKETTHMLFFFLSFVIKFWKVFHYYFMAYWGSCLIFIVTESSSGRTLYECKQHDFCNGNKECKQVKWNKQWELAQWQGLDFKSCHCHSVMLIEYNKATLENDFSDIFIY